MNTHRKNATMAGVFFIIATAAPISTVFFTGYLGGGVAGEASPDYLAMLSANEGQVIIGMLIELIWALAVVGIPVMLYPIFKKHNEASALGFFSLRLIEAIGNIIGSLMLLTLLTLSREVAAVGGSDTAFYQTAGTLLLAVRDWAFMIGAGLVWSLSALLLNYLLYQSKLIPRWLSVWGFIGAALSFATYLLQFFSIQLPEIVFLPIALQEMVFAVWLIVKGVSEPASAAEPA